ncbi:proteobacterial dedicated sortase system histidine kinase [Glaciecola petra]|uniref:histidine kinase n=1 Tax=Glaciecola petra TaxID=3075602 RepID=A0ABU2ZVC1_9ALTE|nr:proteobacterial dedicated sortase system histidine kinase [Aestuariibacter sp. P117]MDT0596593.1 proteobacterial dedicated sortase system histidine kinase [Aestuariibacter sp. P117]
MKRFAFSLRLKLLIFSAFLLAIPYLSYQYVWQLESYLRVGQEQTLVGTARAVATALHERPALFDKQSAFLADIRPGTDLYAHKIQYPIKLDGDLSDWQDYQANMLAYGATNLVEQSAVYQTNSLSFKHMLGQYDTFLYAMFDVTDDSVVMRPQSSLRVDRNDYLQLAMLNASGRFERYIISPYASGWVNAYKLDVDTETINPIALETRIQGQWENTETGYQLELRFPTSMLSSKIAFALGDVDDPNTRQVKYVMGTANPTQSDSLGTVLVPSPEIERIVKGLKYSGARVWVVDKHMRVLARSGDIQDAQGIGLNANNVGQSDIGGSASDSAQIWDYLEQRILLPLYYKILTKPPTDFIDDLADAFALEGRDIAEALDGTPSTLWRLSSDDKAVILSAAHPIYIDEQVMGAVVVEQTTHGIRSLRNQALEKQFHFILAVIVIATLGLFLFASRISNRIRKLRDETEAAIDINGKIVGTMKPTNTRDEIGDLSRSFNQVLSKLSQYNQYLENMASRLSHELRTPVAVVNSSLDNLSLSDSQEDKDEYIGRAKQGIKRLSSILNSMSEATRLEQAISHNEAEEFDLVKLLTGCVKGYAMTYPEGNIQLNVQLDEALLKGSPEMFAQMLDKVVTNAVEFMNSGTPINIRLFKKASKFALSVTNSGPLLPENMNKQLLNSMISVRKSTTAEQAHLGLGLYVANMIAQYHGGHLTIENLPDHSGVIVLFELD